MQKNLPWTCRESTLKLPPQENNFVLADRIRQQEGKLMPENFPVGNFLRKPTNALVSVTCIVKYM
jgi:hypothetical protein